MTTVKLSTKTARAILVCLEENGLGAPVAAELRAALRPSPKKREATRAKRKARESKAKTKREATSEVRAAVMARADMECECGCGQWFGGLLGAAELDHFWGKARAESVETCWALASHCHRLKTNNNPSARHWLLRFHAHCENHGYTTEAARARDRLAFVSARESLGAQR